MLFTCFLAVGFTLLSYANAVIPSYIHVCRRSDPQVSKCIKESVEFIRPRLEKGIKELGVPPLEPFKLRDIDVSDQIPGAKLVLKDVTAREASKFLIKNLKVDMPQLTFLMDIEFPVLQLSGKYDVDIDILAANIKGKGSFLGNATHVFANAVLVASVTKVKGENIFRFNKLDIKLKISEYHITLEAGQGLDPIFIQTANMIVNQNKEEFSLLVAPIIEDKLSEIIMEIANDITTYFNYDEIFPE